MDNDLFNTRSDATDLDLLSKEGGLTKEELLKVCRALDEYLLVALKIHTKVTGSHKFNAIIAVLEEGADNELSF